MRSADGLWPSSAMERRIAHRSLLVAASTGSARTPGSRAAIPAAVASASNIGWRARDAIRAELQALYHSIAIEQTRCGPRKSRMDGWPVDAPQRLEAGTKGPGS